MKAFAKIFTKERVIYGIVISLIGFLGTVYTARTQAATKTQEDLNTFKQTTIADIGDIKGDIKGLRGEITGRLDSIQGTTQTIQSRFDQFIDRQIK